MPLTSGGQAMEEFHAGKLHSGRGGPVVTSEAQAKAIASSTERRLRGRRKPSSRSVRSRRSSRGCR